MNDQAERRSAGAERETEALHSAAVRWEGPLLGGGGSGAVTLDSATAAELGAAQVRSTSSSTITDLNTLMSKRLSPSASSSFHGAEAIASS